MARRAWQSPRRGWGGSLQSSVLVENLIKNGELRSKMRNRIPEERKDLYIPIEVVTEWGHELFHVCPDCGALVYELVVHEAFHRPE
jgi:hypothetical protein